MLEVIIDISTGAKQRYIPSILLNIQLLIFNNKKLKI